MSWDITVPQDTDPIRQGASVIRTLKADLQTALSVEGVFPGAAPASPVFRWKPRTGSVATRPANDPVNPGTVYYDTDNNQFELDTGTIWLALSSVIPPATVQAYMGVTAPAGWLSCDGSAVSRTTYANLYAIIANRCGSGDGSTTFNLPDLRGQFLRGVDGGAGRDPDTGARTAMNVGGNTGDNVGSVQAQGTKPNGLAAVVTDPGHLHTISRNGGNNVSLTGGGGGNFYDGSGSTPKLSTDSATTGITVAINGDTETRPINAYVNFIIKT